MKALLQREMNKRGMNLQQAGPMIMLLVVVGIIGAIGLTVITGVGDTFTADSAAANTTDTIVTSITNFFDLVPVLGTILIAVILLAAVGALAYFGYMRNR